MQIDCFEKFLKIHRKEQSPTFLKIDSDTGVSRRILRNFSEQLFKTSFLNLRVKKNSFADILQNGALKNFVNFTGKHLCWSLFLIKLQATPLLPKTSGRLFLIIIDFFLSSKPFTVNKFKCNQFTHISFNRPGYVQIKNFYLVLIYLDVFIYPNKALQN